MSPLSALPPKIFQSEFVGRMRRAASGWACACHGVDKCHDGDAGRQYEATATAVVTGGEYDCDDKEAADPCAAELFDPESATWPRRPPRPIGEGSAMWRLTGSHDLACDLRQSLLSTGGNHAKWREMDSAAMEMHQVKYFLATAAELNFTKAAERCNVSQPSLTRAIKQLEEEFGGDLFRRERPQVQLTDLGERMLPLMKQIYDSALGARSLASAIKSKEVGSLKLALSHSLDLDILVPHIRELRQLFANLQLRILRGSAADILELLKKGEVELAVASELDEQWERLDRWPLFSESLQLLVGSRHCLASRSRVDMADLRQESILQSSRGDRAQEIVSVLRTNNIDAGDSGDIHLQHDVITMVEAGLGVAIVPPSTSMSNALVRLKINDVDSRRTVYIYGVAGRQRSAVASAILTMLRAADWSRYEN